MSYTPVITITGQIQDFLGNNAVNATVSVRLTNFGTDNPRVPGSCVISSPKVPVTVNGTGGFSFTPIGNDVITPNNTYYLVTFTADNANTASLTIPYQFTGTGSQDLSQIIPFNQGGIGGPQISNIVVKNPTALQIISSFGLSVPQIQDLTAPLLPHTAGGTDIGSAALPFADLYIGNAATNNIRITGSATAARTFTLPDANSNPVQPVSGAISHEWVAWIDSNGVQHLTQPAYSDLSGVPQLAQTIASVSHKWLASYNASTGLFTQTQPDYSDLTGTPQLAITFGAVAHEFLTSYNSTTGNFTAAQPAFSDLSGTASTSQIPSLDASKITTGTFSTSQIPNLDVSKITTGVFSTAFIPNLPASQITSGQLALARGGTGSDLSATGGTSQVLKQTSSGAAITVGQLAFSDLSGSITTGQEPSTTVNAVSNDTNVTGSISAQTMTLGWTGTLAAGRLNSNVVQAVTNDTNVHGSISAQNLTITWSGQLALSRGGTGADLSATGGAHQVLKQSSSGAAVTVGQLAFSDISGTISTGQLPATYISNSAATGIVPVTTDGSGDLGTSNIWSGTNGSGSGEVRIGTTTNILGNTSRLYVWGGSNGCNIDIQADGSTPGSDVAQVEVEGSDYATHINSIAIRYYGPTAIGTFCGINAQSVGVLDIIGSTTTAAIIRAGGNFPLVFGTNDIERSRINATGESKFSSSLIITGAVNVSQVAAPAAPTVTPHNGSASTWAYKIVAYDNNNQPTTGSTAGQTTSGAATLDSTHWNTITWSEVPGASYYKVFRTTVATSPTTTGVIGTVNSGAGASLRDNGLAGDSSSVPATNTTGEVTIPALVLNGSSSGSTLVQATAAASGTLTLPAATDTVVARATTDTLTNKRVTPRVVSIADGTSFTLTSDTADVNTQVNTQSAGTLTANAPSGTPTDGQKLIFRIKSTNVQTYSWNSVFRGSTTTALPTASSGSSKTDYLGFIYNGADSKWDLVAYDSGR